MGIINPLKKWKEAPFIEAKSNKKILKNRSLNAAFL